MNALLDYLADQGRFNRLWKIYGRIGAVLILGIMGLTFVDVIGRYVLHAPLRGAYDMIEVAMTLTIFWFLPELSRSGSHISVELISMGTGPVARLRRFVVELICLVTALAMAWQLYDLAGVFQKFGDASLVIGIPKAPVTMAAAALTGVMAVTHLFRLIALLTGGTPRLSHSSLE
ncbi:TRAP transporter small permease [Paracoccus sp. (in: a-proteobacteria)]|uniref:TRAP transporter small permease n=1 Tax=Paracoccus sp. TaxID=267 RepID=UPI003A883CCB